MNRWSLYQFWPLEAGNENADRFTLTNEQFQFAVAAAQANSHSFTVEPSPVSERVGTYFLFNDLGDLLVRTHDDPNHYQTVGSILDDDVVRRWSDLEGETVRARAKSRYTE